LSEILEHEARAYAETDSETRENENALVHRQLSTGLKESQIDEVIFSKQPEHVQTAGYPTIQ